MAEIAEIAATIERCDLQFPIEILPDGTIIKGHQRLRAVTVLGWTEVDVIVRWDLENNEAETLRELIDDNCVHRQLSFLGLARCYLELAKLPGSRRPAPGSKVRPLRPKNMFAARTGQSERNAARYLNIVKTPMEVQEAFEADKLSLVEASRVAHLPTKQQEAIAEGIRAGESPCKLVRAHLRTQSAAKNGLIEKYETLLKTVRTQVLSLEDCVDRLPVGTKGADRAIDDLRTAGNMLLRLADREEETRQRQLDNLAAIVDEIEGLAGVQNAAFSSCS